jgi:tetratricopeptide (TPR) repeat protein
VASSNAPFVRIAILADYAQAEPSGRFHIVGGGIRALSFAQFPARLAQMSLAIAIEFTAQQVPGASQDALVVVESSDPTGKGFVPVARATPRPRPLTPGGDMSSFEFVINWANIVFERPGTYEFQISYKELELTRVPLIVRSGRALALPTERPWEAGLIEGSLAFNSGQFEAAAHHFEQVTREFPAVAEAWNNLGFVRLGGGAAKQAEECFRRALSLGFANTATLTLNVGCALYVEERYGAAVGTFSEALKAAKFDGPSILYAITRAGLRTVNVPDVQSFSGLGMLNVGWCEARMNHAKEATAACNTAREVAAGPDGTLPTWLSESASQLEDFLTEAEAGKDVGPMDR